MLRRIMIASTSIRIGLEDLLADLQHARRNQELGRLALLAYCEVRTWARQAGEPALAEYSTHIFTQQPSVSKEAFLAQLDHLVSMLEALHSGFSDSVVPPAYACNESCPSGGASQNAH